MGKTCKNSCSEEEYNEEIKIPVPWGVICGKWWGNRDVQPAIAIHGWQDNCGSFDTLAPLLVEKNVSLLCIDLPGHGFSTHFPMGMYYHIFWDGLHILRRIIKHLKFTEKVQILGHSLGGAIAFLYAACYPDEVDCYVSFDIASPVVRDTSKHHGKLGGIIDKFLYYETLTKDKLPRYEYDEMIDIVEDAYGGSCTRKSCEIMMKRGMVKDGNVYNFSRDSKLKTIGLGMLGISEGLDLAKRIKCRVMNVRGNPGMVFEVPEYYDVILDQIEKNAKCLERHVVEGTHHLHLNNPERIYEIVAAFLKRN